MYLRRVIDDLLDETFPEHLPAVALEGAKGVGKTMTASQRCRTVLEMERFAAGPEVTAEVLAAFESPVLLDEWQRAPAVWDVVRRMVDRQEPTRVLLTGSATPPASVALHSGAGRIESFLMRPMSWFERRGGGEVSLGELLDGGSVTPVRSHAGLVDYVDEICSSGFPGIRPLPGRISTIRLDGYVARIVTKEFAEQGTAVRRPDQLRAWLTAYAAATATTASYNSILRAATGGSGSAPSRPTTENYRSVLTSAWILDPVPAWAPAGVLAQLAAAPKHHLVDPGLAARMLGLSRTKLLANPAPVGGRDRRGLLGQLFESLVTQSIRVYAEANNAITRHLRTRDGAHEVDLIVERHDGAVAGIEVKLSGEPDPAAVRHLHWLAETHPDVTSLTVVTTGDLAYRRPDGINVIPLALLRP